MSTKKNLNSDSRYRTSVLLFYFLYILNKLEYGSINFFYYLAIIQKEMKSTRAVMIPRLLYVLNDKKKNSSVAIYQC